MASMLRRSISQLDVHKTVQCSHYMPYFSAYFSVRMHSTDEIVNNNSNGSGEGQDLGPGGDLFLAKVGPDLLGKTAWARRTFDPRSNSQSLLICGGPALAKHASFDPEYKRARDWIRHHAVGPAVLSPILINGLVGALVEASIPQSIPVSSSMQQICPLIVGVEVCAKIEVTRVSSNKNNNSNSTGYESTSSITKTRGDSMTHEERKNGYQVELKTAVNRVRDGAAIAEGTHIIWVPDYLHM